MKLTIHTVTEHSDRSGGPATYVLTTDDAMDAHLRGIIETAIEDLDEGIAADKLVALEIAALKRLLDAGEIDEAWAVFTTGLDATAPQVKGVEDYFYTRCHEIEVPDLFTIERDGCILTAKAEETGIAVEIIDRSTTRAAEVLVEAFGGVRYARIYADPTDESPTHNIEL